jgi:hypothetical protein
VSLKKQIRQYDYFQLFAKIINRIENYDQFNILYVAYIRSHLNVKGHLLCSEQSESITDLMSPTLCRLHYLYSVCKPHCNYQQIFHNHQRQRAVSQQQMCYAMILTSLWLFSSYSLTFPHLQSLKQCNISKL